MERLWQALGDGSGVQTFGVRELARAWYGDTAGPEDEMKTEEVLAGEQLCFAPVAGVPGLWRLRTAVEVRRDAAAGRRAVAGPARPDQTAIQAIIDRHLGDAPDLYRRSVDAATGAVTLSFFFPDVAMARYAEAIATIAEEAGVPVTLASEPHQQALADAALAALPAGLSATRAPSIKSALRAVQVRCDGVAEPAALHDAQQAFREQTGWQLAIVSAAPPSRPAETAVVHPGAVEPVAQNVALDVARELFPSYLGCYKIGLDAAATTLTLRFYFPDVAAVAHKERLEQLAASTGWAIKIHPQAHQEELIHAAAAALPDDAQLDGRPSLDQERRIVVARCRGALAPEDIEAAKAAFAERTGWVLALAAG
jgi:hypothetical protein